MRAPRETRLTAFGSAGSDAADEPPAPRPGAPEEAASPPARTVTEVVTSVKQLLQREAGLSDVWIKGEVSGLKFHSSGHWYFTLKDEQSNLNAAMFRGANTRVRFALEEGMSVLARGRVDVYGARSQLQIIVQELKPDGVGELALRFEQLKRRLAAEGLFDEARKRPIPPHPRRVGIVTSLQAAALRDVVRVATSRHPGIQLVVAPARVQGEGAAEEVAQAIRHLDAHGGCDVLIVGRGGGSIEDLWAFNEEAVVRAVAACSVPVVSAVGHETDFTLSDFAADARAATPSNAAELVVPDAAELHAYLENAEARMAAALERLVPEMHQRVDEWLARAEGAMRLTLDRDRERVAAQAGQLHALSPLSVLERGYAVALAQGRIVRSITDIQTGDTIELVVRDGRADVTVSGTRSEGEHDREEADED